MDKCALCNESVAGSLSVYEGVLVPVKEDSVLMPVHAECLGKAVEAEKVAERNKKRDLPLFKGERADRFQTAVTHGDAMLLVDGENDEVLDLNNIVHLLNNAYIIPFWCGMHPLEHFDGMGGCWGISSGNVTSRGEPYCIECGLYKSHTRARQGNEDK